MDFKQLESFIEVIKLGSFSKAAEKLYLTQPTITNHIQNLEKEIGTLLINRSNKDLRPTEAGIILYKYAQDILNIRMQAELDLNDYTQNIEGNLEINASSVPKQYLLPVLIKDFIKDHPSVTFSVINSDSESIARKIMNGYIDFGITGAAYPFASLSYMKLMEDELELVFPNTTEYRQLIQNPISLSILTKLPLIMREEGSGTRHIFLQALKNNHISPSQLQVVGKVSDNETIKKLVSNNIGVSVMSKNIIQDELANGQLISSPIENLSLSRNFYFVYHQNRHLTPLSETFKRFIIKKEELKAKEQY